LGRGRIEGILGRVVFVDGRDNACCGEGDAAGQEADAYADIGAGDPLDRRRNESAL